MLELHACSSTGVPAGAVGDATSMHNEADPVGCICRTPPRMLTLLVRKTYVADNVRPSVDPFDATPTVPVEVNRAKLGVVAPVAVSNVPYPATQFIAFGEGYCSISGSNVKYSTTT